MGGISPEFPLLLLNFGEYCEMDNSGRIREIYASWMEQEKLLWSKHMADGPLIGTDRFFLFKKSNA